MISLKSMNKNSNNWQGYVGSLQKNCFMTDARTVDFCIHSMKMTRCKETEKILQEIKETIQEDQSAVQKLRTKQLQEQKALAMLLKEAEYYQKTLDVPGVTE